MTRVAPARSAREPVHAPAEVRLRIDPGVCDGGGICAHLAPDLVAVDSWGYPVLDRHALQSRRDLRQAEAAVAACPKRALYLER